MEFAIKAAAILVIGVISVIIGMKTAQEANDKDWPFFRTYTGWSG